MPAGKPGATWGLGRGTPRRLGSGHFVITCTSLLPLRNGNTGEPLAQSDVSSLVGLGDMKKAARTTERALISRAQQIFSIRRRLAFLRELERRLKEQAAVLDAYKPARMSPSLGSLIDRFLDHLSQVFRLRFLHAGTICRGLFPRLGWILPQGDLD